MSSRKNFRAKFKATTLGTLSEQSTQVSEVIGRSRVSFHKITEGNNYFRLAPAHTDSKSYLYPLCVHYLPHQEKDDQGKTITRNKPIFNARIHGGAAKDIVEEYIKLAYRIANDEYDDRNDQKEFMKYITGYNAGKKYIGGIRPNTSWVGYAWDLKEQNDQVVFGDLARLQLRQSTYDDLRVLASRDSGVGTEPYTDIDEGMPINVIYTPTAPPKDKYKSSFAIIGGKNYPTPLPIPDAELDALDGKESLEKIYGSQYSRSDFDAAVAGLRIFDEKHNYGIFESSDFIEILKEISGWYPDDGEETDQGNGELAGLDRAGLKAYIKEHGLAIRIRKSMTDADIRALIVELMEEEEDEEEYDEPNTTAETDDEEEDLDLDNLLEDE